MLILKDDIILRVLRSLELYSGRGPGYTRRDFHASSPTLTLPPWRVYLPSVPTAHSHRAM